MYIISIIFYISRDKSRRVSKYFSRQRCTINIAVYLRLKFILAARLFQKGCVNNITCSVKWRVSVILRVIWSIPYKYTAA